MNVVRAIIAELVALFVDDWTFAAAVLAWLAVVGLFAHTISVPSFWHGIVLFGGLTGILIESVTRRAGAP